MNRFAAILCVVSVVGGCTSDPLGGVPRLSEAELSDSDNQAAIRAEPQADSADRSPGFLGGLFGRGGASAPKPDAAPSAATEPETALQAPSDNAAAPPRRGLLGLFRRAAVAASERDMEQDTTQVAAAPPNAQNNAPQSPSLSAENSASRGLDPGAPDYRIVPLGTELPYGTLARVCDVPKRQLGTRIAGYPERRSSYIIYDSQPGNTGLHSFYMTGFEDGCARQFTAALAMFGSPQTHEQLRYGLPSKVQPYSATDAAYEKLKSKVCRVGRGKPCGSGMNRLARDTVFVSVYERFGSNPVWKTLLLHDGAVIETDIRSN
jgi:hypothetical protein